MMLDFNVLGQQKQARHDNWSFTDDMRKQGLGIEGDVIADGNIHRYTVVGDKAKSNNGWYVLHVDMDFSAGAFGSWKTGEQHNWCSHQQHELSDADREAFKRKMESLKKIREEEQQRVHAECVNWCKTTVFTQAPHDHPYLAAKGIGSHGALLYKDSIVIPVYNDNNIVGVQFIRPDGTKHFKTGSKLKGSYFILQGNNKKVICEGFATGATIHEATGYTVYVAFNAGNLLDVSNAVKADIIAADNDTNTKGNPGLTKAREAAELVGARVVFPNDISGTDFNDLAKEKGIGAVKEAFGITMSRFKQVDDLLDKEFRDINWAIEGLLPEGLAVLSGPPKLGKSWLSLDMCLSIVTGGLTAGHFCTQKGSVLLCALEDNERRLKSRIKMRRGAGMKFELSGPLDFNVLSDPKLPGFYYTTELPRLDEGGMDELVAFLDEHPDCKLVVLDTLAKVKPLARKGGGNAYEVDYKDMGNLQKLALERRCAILVITHNRKTETDDPLQSISGSTGITGVMDTIMLLTRKRGASNAALMVTGRDVSEHSWAMAFDGEHGSWNVVGDGDASGDDAKSEILQGLKSYVDEVGRPATPKQLYEFMGGDALAPKISTIRVTLTRCFNEGIITCHKHAYSPKIPL